MIRILFTYCLFAIATITVAQEPYDEAYKQEAMNGCEEITMFTDRDMYAVNESIRFRSFYSKGEALAGKVWSQVLYVELVTPAGLAIVSGKYFLDDNGSSGSLAIPASAMTGNYFLRGYTKWMRNYGPRSFCYVPLKIINPYTPEVLDDRNEQSPAMVSENTGSNKTITCRTGKDNYSPGEEVQLELTLSDPGYQAPERYCLTIFPAGLGDTLSDWMIMDIPGHCDEFRFDHLPDLRGMSISGTVVKTADQSPSSYARIHFSSMGDQPGYFATLSDRQGRFVLTLPDRTGIHELFLASEPAGDVNHAVLVDHDFSTDPVPVVTQPFTLSTEEEQAATRMIINMQLSMSYGIDRADVTLANDTNPGIPFYGIPGSSVLTDDFIDLPTMTEVFENLVFEVSVYRRRGEPHLRILSPNNNIANYPPLLLVDNIPVFEQKTFLSIDPLKVKKIEVVNQVFIRGNMIWGGIIKLTSKEGDLSSIDLPEESYFINYQAFHPESNDSQLNNWQSEDRVPDTRNTLLWVDDIVLQSNDTKTLQFNASSVKGEYHILVRGVSNSGGIISGVGRFTVK
jgi:hypothetical protein